MQVRCRSTCVRIRAPPANRLSAGSTERARFGVVVAPSIGGLLHHPPVVEREAARLLEHFDRLLLVAAQLLEVGRELVAHRLQSLDLLVALDDRAVELALRLVAARDEVLPVGLGLLCASAKV